YTEGARIVAGLDRVGVSASPARNGSRDAFTDGARSGNRDAFTDGARTGKFDVFTEGANA
ncbi:copper resistance protein CopQ, partial [Cupriavidus sp. 2KB_15]